MFLAALPEMHEIHQAEPAPQMLQPVPVAPARAGPRMGPLIVATFLAGSIVGGVAGAGAATFARPASVPATTVPLAATPASADASASVAAVNAILPAVVTVINRGTTGTEVSSGSGLVIDKDLGYIVTNSHVVEQTRTTQPARFFDVVLSDGTRRSATLVGNDPTHDVAVLKVDGGLPAQATLADSSSVPLGAPVVAIGSPGIVSRGGSALLQNTITSGVVSGKDRALPRADLRNNVQLTDLIQTDAAINPGNSGGPLVWVATKQVIGLNTLVVRGSGEEGLGFAVSSDTVRSIAQQLISRGVAR